MTVVACLIALALALGCFALKVDSRVERVNQVDIRFIKIITHYYITHTTYSNLISVNDMINKLTFFGDRQENRS